MAGRSPVAATPEQMAALELKASGPDRAEADRARAVLLTLRGWTSARIAEAFGVREDTVRLWRGHAAEDAEAVDRGGRLRVKKSNEITAIPRLLDALSLEGATVTIDAMGCQREIARKINDKGADYILALKGNQPALAEDVRLFDAEQSAVNFADATVDQTQTVDGDHGRIETRKVTVYQDVEWLHDRHAWPGLKSVVKLESRREIGDKIETETRFYLASAILTAMTAAAFVRGHWGIENSLHWVLDMVMRDDESRVRTGNAAANLAIIKHIAYNLIRRGKGKHSFRSKRKIAAWDEDYLLSLIRA